MGLPPYLPFQQGTNTGADPNFMSGCWNIPIWIEVIYTASLEYTHLD
ncbi:unnamed protein product [Staurois parvus]|uniref:Uncharacterized protein n=1 Tax=Staurois parvus TaxID=386267 RepID=A0ABN9D9B3_9NEOB|nr:unnamed protein product [Staurois parvus]